MSQGRLRAAGSRKWDHLQTRAQDRVDSSPSLARWVGLAFSVIKAQGAYRLSLDAAGAAFWLILAVFPAALSMIMIYGLVIDPQKLAQDVQALSAQAPASIGTALAQQVQMVAASDTGNLSLGILITLIATLWSVSSAAYALLRAIREAYGLPPQKYIRARTEGMVGAVIGVIVLGLIIGAIGWLVSWWHDKPGWEQTVVAVVAALVLISVLLTLHVAMFRVALGRATGWWSVLPGAVLSTLVSVVLGIGLVLFGTSLADYQAVYGALGSVVLTMLAAYTAVYALLLCAVANALWAPVPGSVPAGTGPAFNSSG